VPWANRDIKLAPKVAIRKIDESQRVAISVREAIERGGQLISFKLIKNQKLLKLNFVSANKI
jgi:hypothetical protein